MWRSLVFAVGLVLVGFVPAAGAQPLELVLPTSNDALLHGDGPSFYQYTDRRVNGVRLEPWEGGQYGFVRNQKDTRQGVIFTRFHEGLDIKPLYRDRRGEPLDTVRSIDAGRVVYVNANARGSNYGKYVVVEHVWSGSPFYSLYAHLGSVNVREGQRLRRGERLGILGYTGDGINRTRAHVHFEINMLLNQEFDRWYSRASPRSRNEHGDFHGSNLVGIDVASLYLALAKDPKLTIRQFLSRQEAFFKIRLPNDGPLDVQYRYPWLASRRFDRDAPAIEVSFTQSGVPVRIESSNEVVYEGDVSWARSSRFDYGDLTNHLASSRSGPDLSSSGSRYLALLTHPTVQTRTGVYPIAALEEGSEESEPLYRARPAPLEIGICPGLAALRMPRAPLPIRRVADTRQDRAEVRAEPSREESFRAW